MKVAIFGLGYVGTVCGACLAELGHEIAGVEVNADKVALLNSGRSPIIEPGLDGLIAGHVSNHRLRATSDALDGLTGADVALICVGTPNRSNGSLNIDGVLHVAGEIGRAFKALSESGWLARYPVAVVRSTVPPGTVHQVAEIIAAASGLKPGEHFGVAANPEFLREGSAIKDFQNPPYTLVGTTDQRAAEVLKALYSGLPGEFIVSAPGPAELLKFVNNSWHALKVAFANEVGSVCKAAGLDSHQVMDLFCQDSRLNVSAAYLRPGFAYGGSCLPKDLAALNHIARAAEVSTPVLAAVAPSNAAHIQRAVDAIHAAGSKAIGVLGLSFKPGTDDLRESPTVELVQILLGRGYKIRIYDSNVNLSRLIGANKSFIEQHIGHIGELLAPDLESVIVQSDVLVVANGDPEFRDVMERLRPDQKVIDLVRIDRARTSSGEYEGICW